MNDLTTQNSPPATPTTPELGKALSELLDSAGSPDAAAREIAWRPELLAEAVSVLPALKAVAEHRAGADGVRRVIAKRFPTYPQPQRTDEEWADWWADYMETLEDVSLASLEAAMRAYVAMPGSEFMPKPGRLRELAFLTPCRALQRFQRAKRAVQISCEQPEPRDPTPEERTQAARTAEENAEAIRKIAAEFKAKSLSEATALRPPLPYIGGIPDERGITPQMRELMARRAREGR